MQEQALEKTTQRLSDLGIENAELILDGHENLDHYVTEPIRAAIFNLGYLPSADKSVITKPHTTLEAIEKILDRLEVGGRLAIMIYYGHDGGDMEKDAAKIKKKLASLEVERCHKLLAKEDVTAIDKKISKQKELFSNCCHKEG